ncbi:hypothetical protein TrST_g3073 [Triparma strigata]|uniref:Uncharacterized protein n=1 Tax=Triparma strigata TaxID=1606541 RepID=A0A9W7AP10_9STRA|nr:hypothetical protein TrST_g3073 [Triparma strigata]
MDDSPPTSPSNSPPASPRPKSSLTHSSLPKAQRIHLRRLRRLASGVGPGNAADEAEAKRSKRSSKSGTSGSRIKSRSLRVPPAITDPLAFLLALPSPFLMFPLITSGLLFFLPKIQPHSTGSYTETSIFLTYTRPVFTDQSLLQLFTGSVFSICSSVLLQRSSPIESIRSALKSVIALTLLVTAGILLWELSHFIQESTSYMGDGDRLCIPHSDPISDVVREFYSGGKSKKCSTSELVFVPVPWLEEGRVPGSTVFGSVHRGSRVNQIPYGNSRFSHKLTLNWNLRSWESYNQGLVTDRDEVKIAKASSMSNSSYTWIVKSCEGRAKLVSNRLDIPTFWVGENPYAGIAHLKGNAIDEERMLRQTKARKERLARSKEEDDKADNEEERQRQLLRDQRRQEQLKGELLRTELTEEYMNKKKAESARGRREQEEEDEEVEDKYQEGHHIVSRYITNPELVDGLKYHLELPVVVTSLEPLRVYVDWQNAMAKFAEEEYVEGEFKLERDYTRTGEIRSWSDVEKVRGGGEKKKKRGKVRRRIEEDVFEVLWRGLKEWKDDVRLGRELLESGGTRPTGSGGLGKVDAGKISKVFASRRKAWEKEFVRGRNAKEKRKKRERERKREKGNEEEMVGTREIEGETYGIYPPEEEDGGEEELKAETISDQLRVGDSSSFTGGGFHVFGFDFLFDETGGIWLLDIDSLPNFDRRDVSDTAVEMSSEEVERYGVLMNSVFGLVGWQKEGGGEDGGGVKLEYDLTETIETAEVLRLRGGEEAGGEEEDDINALVCSSYAQHIARSDTVVCAVRLAEMELEGKRKASGEFSRVHPSVGSCTKLQKGKKEMEPLDAAACSKVFLIERDEKK